MTSAGSRPNQRPISLWRRPLLVGVCFGLGFGVTKRLLDLRLPGFVQWGQAFDVRQMPGTGLDSLRLRFGSDVQELRGRLDLLELKPETPVPPDKAGAAAIDAPPESSALTAPATAPAAPVSEPVGQDQAAPDAPKLPPPAAQP